MRRRTAGSLYPIPAASDEYFCLQRAQRIHLNGSQRVVDGSRAQFYQEQNNGLGRIG